MKNVLTSTAAICMIALLSACGGGGGSNYSDGGPGVPVERPTGPASNDPATLAAWAKDGGNTNDLFNTQGIKRTSRTVTDAEGTHRVRVDRVNGYGDGLVAYQRPDGTTIYQLADNAAPLGQAMSGVYTGRISAEWTPNAAVGRQSGEDNVALTLNTESGRGTIDSIIGGSNSNLEVMGDLALNGNKLSASDVVARFRTGEGAFMRDEEALIDASVIGRNGVNAIMGTVVSDNANGGFAADLNPQFSGQ